MHRELKDRKKLLDEEKESIVELKKKEMEDELNNNLKKLNLFGGESVGVVNGERPVKTFEQMIDEAIEELKRIG